MKTLGEKTVSNIAKRSELIVWGSTVFVALAASVFAVISGAPATWASLIPLCFMTIPPIHYLCREVLRLRSKLDELEKRLG